MMSLSNKIRVWCKTTKHFSDVPFLCSSGHHLLWLHTGNEISLTRTDDSDYIIHRYTEFKDINGVEVYQGDIISTTVYGDWGDSEPYEVINLVEWSHIQVGWRGFTKKMLESTPCSGNIFGAETKVIGNVCQNENLL